MEHPLKSSFRGNVRDVESVAVPLCVNEGAEMPYVHMEPSTAPLPDLAVPTGAGALRLRLGSGMDARTWAVDERIRIFGRGAAADVRIHDRGVSRRHFSVERAGPYARVRDLGSRNGVWVDGVRVDAAVLRSGATLLAGRSVFRVESIRGGHGGRDIVADSPAMRRVIATAERFAPSSLSVVVVGESGVGKEGVARLLHDASGRRGRFVVVNAGALRAETMASELFGHVRGAFTGAVTDREGAFVRAERGTLFLDEIGELPPSIQAALLRVLEVGVVKPMGSDREVPVEARLVCATHRDLRAAVRSGSFREDLYYRVCRLQIGIPPLRSRPEDIGSLANHFASLHAEGSTVRALTESAIRVLRAHHWPGNARELSNVVARAHLSASGPCISDDDIREALGASEFVDDGSGEAIRIVQAMVAHGMNKAAAARALGIPRTTLRDRLARIDPGAYQTFLGRSRSQIGSPVAP